MHLGSWLTCYAILYINLALENYFIDLDFLNSCKAIFPNIYLYMIIPLKATRGIDVKLVGLHCIIWNAAIPLTLWSVLKCFKKFKHRHTKMLEHESRDQLGWNHWKNNQTFQETSYLYFKKIFFYQQIFTPLLSLTWTGSVIVIVELNWHTL